MSSDKDLIVWKKSFDFCADVYEATKSFPKDELYGLTSQLRRAVISIPSNISEGSKRGQKEFLQFLKIAQGSAAEAETQIMLAYRLKYISNKEFEKLSASLVEIMKMLNAFIKRFLTDNEELRTKN